MGHRAAHDATAVARMRAAGAIVLGKTNCPEFLANYETDNFITGRSNNPWKLDRTPGGSSGGEGAIIAAGGSPLGLGGDFGGSLQSAFISGIVMSIMMRSGGDCSAISTASRPASG